MKTAPRILIIIVALLVGLVSTTWSREQQFADILIQAEAAGQKIPLASIGHPDMDEPMAYRIQKDYINKKSANETLAGFKAGLTSKGSQQKFGVGSPVAGALFASGKSAGGAAIDKKAFHKLMLETEIGFVVDSALTTPVPDVAALRKSIRAFVPVIELPDLGFADMKQLKGVDIIAANVAARQFILGDPKPAADVDPNAVLVTLSLDGKEINRASGADALGDQWKSALWLVNKMIGQGWTIAPGHVLLTGALGKMVPGKPGKYVADYGDFGKIAFEVR